MIQAKVENRSFDVVALATSAGGLKALSQVLSALPSDFPVAIIVLQHLSRHYRSYLVHILSQRTPLKVIQAAEGDRLQPGCVYVAPPNRHLLVNADSLQLSLTQTAPVHFVRPSADVLFESMATAFGKRAIAVVLTGSGVDGASGLQLIQQKGGTIIAQSEASSEFTGMPKAAVKAGIVGLVLPLEAIAPTLMKLAGRKG